MTKNTINCVEAILDNANAKYSTYTMYTSLNNMDLYVAWNSGISAIYRNIDYWLKLQDYKDIGMETYKGLHFWADARVILDFITTAARTVSKQAYANDMNKR